MKCTLLSLFTAGLKHLSQLSESHKHQPSKPNRCHLYKPTVSSGCGIAHSSLHLQEQVSVKGAISPQSAEVSVSLV